MGWCRGAEGPRVVNNYVKALLRVDAQVPSMYNLLIRMLVSAQPVGTVMLAKVRL